MAVTDFFTGGKGAGAKPPEETKPPEGPAAAVFRYRCFEACTFQKRYRKAGDIIELSEKRDIPHFKPVI